MAVLLQIIYRRKGFRRMSGVVGTGLVCQVGFIVKDIYATKKKWAEFLGVEEPEANLCGEYEIMQTEYMGAPAPEANSLLAFFDVGPGLQLELIQPNEAPSTWRNYLNEHGEGIHHVAFQIQGMKMPEAVERCQDFGMSLEQKGEYGDASGRYVYMNAYKDLKCIIELLESDKHA